MQISAVRHEPFSPLGRPRRDDDDSFLSSYRANASSFQAVSSSPLVPHLQPSYPLRARPSSLSSSTVSNPRMGSSPHRLPGPSRAPSSARRSQQDPQIVLFQCLHYLTLSFILPPILSYFASPLLLSYEGGPTAVSMVMDWREFTGLSTVGVPAARGAMGGLVGLKGVPDRKSVV